MKIYKPNNQKSWGISLRYLDSDVGLIATDIITGETIAILLVFTKKGSVITCENADIRLKKAGYNPHEHNNTFTDRGKIVIS